MRDNLDLQELRDRSEYYRSQSRRIRNRTLIFILGALIILAWLYVQHQNPIGHLYYRDDDSWVILDNAVPVDIQSAPDGSVWIQTLQMPRMIHATEYDWREYNNREFDFCCFDFEGIFTTYGTTVLAQHKDHLAKFDGHEWTVYPSYFPVRSIREMGANSYSIFIFDFSYNLYVNLFDTGWNKLNIDHLISEDATPPKFVNVNSEVYLHLNGLHVFDGENFEKRLSLPGNSIVLGHTDTDIGIRTDDSLLMYDAVLDNVTVFSENEIGLPIESIQNVFADNSGQAYFATDVSIYKLHNGTWQFDQSIDTLYGIKSIGVTPNGTWVIASSDVEFARSPGASTYSLVQLLFPILLPVIIFAVIFYLLSTFNRKLNAVRTERSRKLISALISDFEVDEKKIADARKPPIGFIVRLIGGFVCAMFVPVFLRNTEIPPEISSFAGYIVLLGILFLPYLRKIINFRDKTETAQRWRLWGLYFSGFFAVFMIVTPLIESAVSLILPEFDQPLFIVFAIYAGLWFLYFVSRRRKPSRILPKSLAQVKYDKAVKDVWRL